jgi:hypothetical protein
MKKLTATPPAPVTKADPVIAIAEFFDRLDRGGRTIKIRTHEGTRTKRLPLGRGKPIFKQE